MAGPLSTSMHGIVAACMALFANKNMYHAAPMVGTVALDDTWPSVLVLDPGGVDREVTLDAVATSDGLTRFIANSADAEEVLTAKNVAGATIATIYPDELYMLHCDGADWHAVAIRASRPTAVIDPGDAAALPVDGYQDGLCMMTSAGAETRTLADPTLFGQRFVLVADTYGGDIVVTAASPCNVVNNNTLTFGAASEALSLEAVTAGGVLVWQIGWNDAVGLSTV